MEEINCKVQRATAKREDNVDPSNIYRTQELKVREWEWRLGKFESALRNSSIKKVDNKNKHVVSLQKNQLYPSTKWINMNLILSHRLFIPLSVRVWLKNELSKTYMRFRWLNGSSFRTHDCRSADEILVDYMADAGNRNVIHQKTNMCCRRL